MQLKPGDALQCLEPWLDNMPDPNVIAEGLTDMDTWLASPLGPLTVAINAVNKDLKLYSVSFLQACLLWLSCFWSVVYQSRVMLRLAATDSKFVSVLGHGGCVCVGV